MPAMVDHPPIRDHGLFPDLEPEHCRAIRNEIGERLRDTVADDTAPLPSRLEGLVKRLTELDGRAPLNVPDPEDTPASLPLWKRVMRFWRLP